MTSAQPQDWTEPGAYEVAPGVHRIPLPLPGDGLKAVNVYAIDDGDGLVLIDSGWALDEARELLVAALATLGAGIPDVHSFLVTHVHRDHFTQAVALRREFGTRIALGKGEQETLHLLQTTPENVRPAMIAQLRRHGADEMADILTANVGESSDMSLWENPDDWLAGETVLDLHGRSLVAIPTPGHTQGHVVFADRQAGLLFAGDHVLPHITPSIGVEAVRTPLPLGDYLDSLRLVRQLPDSRLLPAHGPVTDSVHARIDELVEHHDVRLAATAAAVRAGADTAAAVAGVLPWTRRERRLSDLDPYNYVLAVMETVAHLEVLVHTGQLRRTEVDDRIHYSE